MARFHIRETDTAVELWSGYRIPFGGTLGHPGQRDPKAELKAALSRLVTVPGSAFSGYYDSTDPRPTDAENSLFTNLLEAMPSDVRFLSFEQGASRPPASPTPIDLGGNHLHYYRYQANCQWTAWEADRILARWNRVPRQLPGDGSARPAWFAMRDAHAEGLVELTGEALDSDSDFGLRILIHAARNGPRNAISNSESIVDGIIAAFHNDRFSDALSSALAPKLPNVAAQELRDALDSPIGPLFDTPAIIHSSAGFVQISPADERCLVGELVICNDSTSQWTELSGELFTIRPAKGAGL